LGQVVSEGVRRRRSCAAPPPLARGARGACTGPSTRCQPSGSLRSRALYGSFAFPLLTAPIGALTARRRAEASPPRWRREPTATLTARCAESLWHLGHVRYGTIGTSVTERKWLFGAHHPRRQPARREPNGAAGQLTSKREVAAVSVDVSARHVEA